MIPRTYDICPPHGPFDAQTYHSLKGEQLPLRLFGMNIAGELPKAPYPSRSRSMGGPISPSWPSRTSKAEGGTAQVEVVRMSEASKVGGLIESDSAEVTQ